MTGSQNDFGHGYDHQALDVIGGALYRHWGGSRRIRKYDLVSGALSFLPDDNQVGYAQVAIGVEFFPDINSIIKFNAGENMIGGFTSAGITRFNGGVWSRLGQVNQGVPSGTYHAIAKYNPVHHLILMGGGNGSRKLWLLYPSLSIVPTTDCPEDCGVGPGQSVSTVDPVSGKFLFFFASGNLMALDPTNGQWSLISSSTPLGSGSRAQDRTAAGYIQSYGVTFWLDCDEAIPPGCAVRLYKSSSGSLPPPDSTPPTAPTNLRFQGVVIAWNPSTDNIGVTGYKIFDNNVEISQTTNLSIQLLLADGIHNISIKARDAAGNLSAESQGLTIDLSTTR